MKVAVIPARGGSRRIPRKNVRDFCGKPMIVWSIETALASGLFDRVVVSTDDGEIRDVARSAGAEVPFLRPSPLADDFTGTIPVMAHAVRALEAEGAELGPVCCIYPTAPLLQAEDLARGLETLVSGDWLFTFAAAEFRAPIWRAFQLEPDGGVRMFFPEHQATRSQDLPTALHDAGQFYWGWRGSWLEQAQIFGPRSAAIRVPASRVVDIDTPEDWALAESLAAGRKRPC